MLCFASILVPSFTSGFLYVTFLCCVTYWACDKNLGKNFAYLCRFLCVIIFFYIVAIFCYQTEWVQEQLSPSSEIPKYEPDHFSRNQFVYTFLFWPFLSLICAGTLDYKLYCRQAAQMRQTRELISLTQIWVGHHLSFHMH